MEKSIISKLNDEGVNRVKEDMHQQREEEKDGSRIDSASISRITINS